MDEHLIKPQLENVHFPRQIGLIKKLRAISFIINDITLIASFLVIGIWIFNIPGLKQFLFQTLKLHPFTPVLFILSCIPLFFCAKSHLLTTHKDAEKEDRPLWVFTIPIFCGAVTALLGFINFMDFTNTGMLSWFHISPFTGLCFSLIGLALIPPYTLLPYRFHITQFLIFIISGLNVFVILEILYQFFSAIHMQNMLHISLATACSFVLFCSGLLLRWSNRGFLGNFTLDSTASIFAFRVFAINLISAPLIALIVLFLMRKTFYNMYVVLSIVVVCFAFVSSLLLWINIRILYSHELEHLLMRESLRFHNIDLTKEQDELLKKMVQIEREKQQYIDKLTSQEAWQSTVERLE